MRETEPYNDDSPPGITANCPNPLVLATDLDGTFLGGSQDERARLYDWISKHRSQVTLVFVSGRDLPFIRGLVAEGWVPAPDYVIGDVGTTIAAGPDLEPIEVLEQDIAKRWADSGNRIRALLASEPGLTPQPVNFRYRMSYFYEPEKLRPETRHKIEIAGFDCLLSAGVFLDVLPRGVAKGPTLTRLLAHLGLHPGTVLVAGDTMNDLSLFQTGLAGVAVGNSEAALIEQISALPHVFHSPHPGAAGILDALHHHRFIPEVFA